MVSLELPQQVVDSGHRLVAAWVQLPAVPPLCCVNVGKWLNLSEPQQPQ